MKPRKKHMEHWNGNLMCAIDVETTGLDPSIHEIVQLAIIPLDSNIRPLEDVLPLNIQIKPEQIHDISHEAMSVNRIELAELMVKGFDKEVAKDYVCEWIDNLGLSYTKFGTRMKIIPIGQNYAFDRAFIQKWLGVEMYEDLFRHDYRDTMLTALYLNDRAAMHANPVPYNKVNLTWLAKTYNVEYRRKHDALSDAYVSAQVYKKQIEEGLIG